eukprot:TRINITY_DN10550_c0_g1_i3.p1 TRINITY_DN10550_c0_g1~~TRINITY_DN10550_c0_g1_i3.p1  ORF type:complete len:333 (-),score=61.02 TRINITY_DN10550_c0_g1_i3:176-1033(-)
MFHSRNSRGDGVSAPWHRQVQTSRHHHVGQPYHDPVSQTDRTSREPRMAEYETFHELQFSAPPLPSEMPVPFLRGASNGAFFRKPAPASAESRGEEKDSQANSLLEMMLREGEDSDTASTVASAQSTWQLERMAKRSTADSSSSFSEGTLEDRCHQVDQQDNSAPQSPFWSQRSGTQFAAGTWERSQWSELPAARSRQSHQTAFHGRPVAAEQAVGKASSAELKKAFLLLSFCANGDNELLARWREHILKSDDPVSTANRIQKLMLKLGKQGYLGQDVAQAFGSP